MSTMGRRSSSVWSNPNVKAAQRVRLHGAPRGTLFPESGIRALFRNRCPWGAGQCILCRPAAAVILFASCKCSRRNNASQAPQAAEALLFLFAKCGKLTTCCLPRCLVDSFGGGVDRQPFASKPPATGQNLNEGNLSISVRCLAKRCSARRSEQPV